MKDDSDKLAPPEPVFHGPMPQGWVCPRCGAIAKALGGGGHKGAAGFVCDDLPWNKETE